MRKYFTLAPYFQDFMVFQANKKIKISGKCKKHVEISVSFLDQEKTIKTTDTTFDIYLDPFDYQDKGFSFTVKCKKQVETIYNCLIGDVYLFIGGKNIHQSIKESCKTKDYDNENIRFINFAKDSKWVQSSRDSLVDQSVLAYLFSKNLHSFHKVPLGIMTYSHPQENIFSWLSEATVLSNVDIKNYINGVFQNEDLRLAKDYQNLCKNLSCAQIKSLILYQGENDFNHYHFYEKALNFLTKTYRLSFKDTFLPIYIVQMSSFEGNAHQRIASSEIRIAQSHMADEKQKIYVVSVVDIDEKDVVSLNKNILSKRLVNLVLEKEYHIGKHAMCPQLFSYKKRKDQLDIITYQNYLSLTSRSGQKLGFYATDNDVDFYPIKDVSIINNQISLKVSESMKEVRYACDDNPTCDIFTSNGLPLLPFKIAI